jgi:hypothetical protein
MNFTLNFYTAFYLFSKPKPRERFTDFRQFYTHFLQQIFSKIFKGIPDENKTTSPKWVAVRLGTRSK